MTGTARWLIVCDCAGRPEEQVGAVDVDAAGDAAVWDTGRGGGATLTGAHQLIRDTPHEARQRLIGELRTRTVKLPTTVMFRHPPCGLNLRVSEARLGELLAATSNVVAGHRVQLAVLCAVNGRLPGGATRPNP